MLLTFIGLEAAGATANAAYSRWIETLFAPTAAADLRAASGVLAALVAVAPQCGRRLARSRAPRGARARRAGWPVDRRAARCREPRRERSCAELWNLIRGAAPLASPRRG